MTEDATRCVVCGVPLEPGALFCAGCGVRVAAPGAAPDRAPVADGARVPGGAPVPVAAPVPGGAPVPDGTVVADPSRRTRRAADARTPATRAERVGPVDPARVAPVAPIEVASIGVRVVAFLLDQVLLAAVAAVAYAGLVAGGDDTPHVGALTVVALVVWVAVAVGQWVAEATTGATVGNLVCGIRTLSARTRRPAGLLAVFVRDVVLAAGTLACFVGAYVVAASGAWDAGPARRGWHDKAAGTVVLRAARAQAKVPDTTWAPPDRVALAAAEAAAAAARDRADAEPRFVPAAPDAPRDAAPDRAPGEGPGRRPPAAAPLITPFAVPSGAAEDARPPATGPGLVEIPDGVRPEHPATSAVLAVPAVPGAGVDLDAGLGRTRLRGPGPAVARLHLVLDTGEWLEVRGDGLVGRGPTADGSDVVHLVPVGGDGRSVSKTHLGFGPQGTGLWVQDRGSTNGSVVEAPDGTRSRLVPHERARVEAGWTVHVGDRSFRVVADGGAG